MVLTDDGDFLCYTCSSVRDKRGFDDTNHILAVVLTEKFS